MYIKHIEIDKYRHIEKINLGPFYRPGDASDLVVLAGPNGSGKSSILELISLALSNMWSLAYKLNRTHSTSSFEVTIGLLPSELKLIRERQEQSRSPVTIEALEYLLKNQSYRRSFNFDGGEYAKASSLHNHIHSLVQEVLRQSYSRPLGFHLGADRSYERTPFVREKLFNYSQYSTYNYTWQYAFDTSSAQYKDMFDYLVTWRYHFTRRLGSYYIQRDAGALQSPTDSAPVDVYGQILTKVFPNYQFVDKAEDAPTDLYVRIPTGDVIPFSDLSSGEKEVFFTLCFLQRHEVEEATIIIDEPELHLHPNLARVLMRTLLELKPRNQIWLATQSAEVIDEAGRDRVLFVRRNQETRRAEVLQGSDEEESLQLLRDLFGQSGYIGLAKAMIFTEGRNASADRKMFSKLFPYTSRDIKIIPANGCSEIERINRAVLAILESNMGICKFFLCRDRDYMTEDTVTAMRGRAGPRLIILDRHEIENYLLNVDVISKLLDELYDLKKTPSEVDRDLATCCREMAGDVLRDMVAFRLNYQFRPEDFSVGQVYKGKLTLPEGGTWDAMILNDLQTHLATRAGVVTTELRGRVEGCNFDSLFAACKLEVESAISTDRWSSLFPGKELLNSYCRKFGLGKAPLLSNAIIKEMAAHRAYIPDELSRIIDTVVA